MGCSEASRVECRWRGAIAARHGSPLGVEARGTHPPLPVLLFWRTARPKSLTTSRAMRAASETCCPAAQWIQFVTTIHTCLVSATGDAPICSLFMTISNWELCRITDAIIDDASFCLDGPWQGQCAILWVNHAQRQNENKDNAS